MLTLGHYEPRISTIRQFSDGTTYTTTATLLTPDTNTTITTTTIHDDGRTTVGAVVVADGVQAEAEEHDSSQEKADGDDNQFEARPDHRTGAGPLMRGSFWFNHQPNESLT